MEEEKNVQQQPEPSGSPGSSQPNKKKKTLLIIAGIVLVIALAVLFLRPSDNAQAAEIQLPSSAPSWAIYVYLCGSNLESELGSATDNIAELRYEDMPANLTFVIESGGTTKWNNNSFEADRLQRWTFTADKGLVWQEDLPQGNMSDVATLQNFLAYCHDNFPADNTMLIVWDHGNGPVYGVCSDENYPETTCLQTKDIASALEATFGSNPSDPPLDIIDFDCCLMSSVDMAVALQGKAHYMIASQEVMSSVGESYEGFVADISKNPSITPLEFGKKVVENFGERYTKETNKTNQTLSMIDITKIGPVDQAVNDLSAALIRQLYSNPEYFTELARSANDTEYYGDHIRATKAYDNLVDVRDFAMQVGADLPESQALFTALDQAVVANFHGYYHPNSCGLSMFYSYNGDPDEMSLYLDRGISLGSLSLNELHVTGQLTGERNTFVSGLGLNANAVPNLKTFQSAGEIDRSVKINSDGRYYVDFGPAVGACMTNVMETLYAFVGDEVVVLGTDDEVDADPNEGIIIDNFGGKWLQIGDYVACVDLSYDSDEYNIYSIPIKLVNDEDDDLYYLQLVYNYQTKEWTNLGMRLASANAGESRATPLTEGTEIRIIQFFEEEHEDGLYNVPYQVGTVTYSDDIVRYAPLPNGTYVMELVAEDVHKNTLRSEYYRFEMVDGNPVYENKGNP